MRNEYRVIEGSQAIINGHVYLVAKAKSGAADFAAFDTSMRFFISELPLSVIPSTGHSGRLCIGLPCLRILPVLRILDLVARHVSTPSRWLVPISIYKKFLMSRNTRRYNLMSTKKRGRLIEQPAPFAYFDGLLLFLFWSYFEVSLPIKRSKPIMASFG